MAKSYGHWIISNGVQGGCVCDVSEYGGHPTQYCHVRDDGTLIGSYDCLKCKHHITHYPTVYTSFFNNHGEGIIICDRMKEARGDNETDDRIDNFLEKCDNPFEG